MRRILFLFFIIACSCQAFAQSPNLDNLVKSFFDDPSQIKWLRHYVGNVDDINIVNVTLAFDGLNCKGTMTYLRSNEVLKLEGNIEGKTLKLAEINKQKETSGFLEGELIGKTIEAEWTNYNGKIGRKVSIKEVSNQAVTFNDYDNQWVRRYKGILKSRQEMEMILQHTNANELKGVAYLINTGEKMKIIGTINKANRFKLDLFNKLGEKQGTLDVESTKNKDLRADYEDLKTGKQYLSSFGLESVMEVESFQFTNYSVSYEILYPKSKNAAFNAWVKKEVKRWIANCESQVSLIKKNNIVENPETRATRRAYVWFDIEHLSEEIISGDFTYSNTWDKKVESKVFNFDLKKEEPIELNDLLKKNPDLKSFLNKYIEKKNQQNVLYNSDEVFRTWVSKQKFDKFTIQKIGLSFQTNFDEIYGKIQVIVPYGELKPFFKKNNPIM